MSIHPVSRTAKNVEVQEFREEVETSKAALEITKGLFENATSFWSGSLVETKDFTSKNLISLKRSEVVSSDAKDIQSLCEFLHLSSFPDLSKAEFDFLVEIVKRNKVFGNSKDLLSILHMELYFSLSHLLRFIGISSQEEILKQEICCRFLPFIDLTQNPKEFNSQTSKKTFFVYKNIYFKSFADEFECNIKQNKLSKLKSREKKEQINQEKESLLNNHLRVFSLLEKLYFFNDALQMLQSPIGVFPEGAFSTSEDQRDGDLQRVQSFICFEKILRLFYSKQGNNSSEDKEYVKLLGDIDRFIQRFLEQKDLSKRESLSKDLVFILDWIEKEAKQPIPSHSRYKNVSDYSIYAMMSFELLYYLIHFPKIEPNFSFQTVSSRVSGLSRFWAGSHDKWREELGSRVLPPEMVSLNFYENQRLNFVTPKINELFYNIFVSTQGGCSSLVARSEFRGLHKHLSEVLPSVFRELNAYCAQNLEGFDRREYISSNLWLVCILLIQSDLEVSLTGSLVKEFEVVLSPFLEICEQTLILKAHSNKTSLASLIEQEKESESEDLEIEEMVESLTLDTPLKIEPLALVANKVEEVRASNFGNTLPRHLEKPKEKQRKEREKISAQDLLSLRGKNIRLISKLLEEAGFERKRSGKGSHEIWGPNRKEGYQAVIPKQSTVSPGVLKSIADQLSLEKRLQNK